MSGEEVLLKDLPQRKVVYVPCKGSWRQLPDMLARLSEYVSQSGIETAGPPSGFYHNTPEEVAIEELAWEVCYDVKPNTSERAEDKPKSGVREIPATRVAAVIHKGSYRKASPSYEKLQGWIEAHGLKVCGPARSHILLILIRQMKNNVLRSACQCAPHDVPGHHRIGIREVK